ncbi:MAG: phytoene desaturase [Chitinispirillaceae bacterium]|nr:phytoene desaturase [Chitinispirillaceae bacterium]
MAEKKKISIVGAGIGGMSAAISCAANGYDVTVFEKNDKVGGKLNVLTAEGFSFDLGPSILTLPHIFERLFAMHDRKLGDYVDTVALDTHWRNFFEDGTVLDLYADSEKTAAHLESKFAGAGNEYRLFVEYSKRQYEIVAKKYFNDGLDTFGSFFTSYGWPELFFKLDLFRTMNASVSRFFTDQQLRDVFNYFIKYVGSSAYNAPGFMNLMPWVQIGFGLWYVKGGMYNMARGMARLMEEVGVTVHCDSEVTEIMHERGRVTGVVLKDGTRHVAEAVISNMEVIPAYEKLIGESGGFMRKLEKFEPACSGIVLHLGLDTVYPQLAHHNFVYSNDQRHHFDLVFNQRKLPTDPTIYLVAPTRTDPAQAPEGCDNLKLLPHIPFIDKNNPVSSEEYEALAERTIDKLEAVGLKEIRKHIVVRDFWTPVDIQSRYYSNKGSIYGVVSDRKKNFALKAPKKSTRYAGLYFVGGSVNPGAGMPMVCLCGQNAAKLVARDLK